MGGDTSDNIPGLRGVGPKTASKWLIQYKTLEEIIAHCGELNPKRFQSLVYEEADSVRMNLKMTLLDRDLPIDDNDHVEPNPERAVEILRDMEMGKSADDLVRRQGNA